MRGTTLRRRTLAIAIALVVLLGLAGTGTAAPRDRDSVSAMRPSIGDLLDAILAQQRNHGKLRGLDGVVGTGVASSDGGVAVVRVYSERALVPGLPRTVDGIPVQVEVTGLIMAQVDPTDRFPRPVPTGVSTGHPSVTAGTIGARVTKDGKVYALSNNHVYADSNGAAIGSNVLQPGAVDGGQNPGDAIGTLAEYQTINFQGGNNTIDAAIALTTTSQLGNSTTGDGYGAPSSTTVAAYVGQPVQKYGRTTGLTEGLVEAVNVEIDVCYESFWIWCSALATFVNQIEIQGTGATPNFSDGGDSGSLIVTDDASANPVALLFAGGGNSTFANPIDLVLNHFGVTIDSGGAPPPPPVDETPPETSITSGPSGTTTSTDASFQFSANEASTFECDLDGGGWGACTSPRNYSGLGVGGHTFSVRATDGSNNTDPSPATRSWTIEPPPPPPPSGTELYLAVGGSVSPGGTALANEDIAAFDGSSFSVHFDGSDVGLGSLALDAFAITGPNEILMSFSVAGSVPGLGTVDDSDIVRFNASSLGLSTAGTFSMHFDGSDVGLTRNGEDVDAIEVLANGRILVSTSGGVRVSGVSGADEDLLSFNPSSLGASTSGAWSKHFDGSDVALNNSSGEDVDAVAVSGGDIYLSTRGSFSVAGLSGADEDVIEFDPTSLGGATAGSFVSPRTLDGSTVGLGGTDVVAIDLP